MRAENNFRAFNLNIALFVLNLDAVIFIPSYHRTKLPIVPSYGETLLLFPIIIYVGVNVQLHALHPTLLNEYMVENDLCFWLIKPK